MSVSIFKVELAFERLSIGTKSFKLIARPFTVKTASASINSLLYLRLPSSAKFFSPVYSVLAMQFAVNSAVNISPSFSESTTILSLLIVCSVLLWRSMICISAFSICSFFTKKLKEPELSSSMLSVFFFEILSQQLFPLSEIMLLNLRLVIVSCSISIWPVLLSNAEGERLILSMKIRVSFLNSFFPMMLISYMLILPVKKFTLSLSIFTVAFNEALKSSSSLLRIKEFTHILKKISIARIPAILIKVILCQRLSLMLI